MKMRPQFPKSEDDIQLSQSALEMFFPCPARYRFATQWSRKIMPVVLKDGIDTHAILTGEQPADASPNAYAYAASLRELLERYQITLTHQEVEQVFELEPGIWYKRIIDGIGYFNGEPVIIDWKTSSSGLWPIVRQNGRVICPKGMTFQAVSYLIPPPDEMIGENGLDKWPSMFMFLVSDTRDNGGVVVYTRNPEMEQNFLQACRTMAQAIRTDNFPKVYGSACGVPGTRYVCNYFEICHQMDNWWELFVSEGRTEVDP